MVQRRDKGEASGSALGQGESQRFSVGTRGKSVVQRRDKGESCGSALGQRKAFGRIAASSSAAAGLSAKILFFEAFF